MDGDAASNTASADIQLDAGESAKARYPLGIRLSARLCLSHPYDHIPAVQFQGAVTRRPRPGCVKLAKVSADSSFRSTQAARIDCTVV
jgi:hypothetical protein